MKTLLFFINLSNCFAGCWIVSKDYRNVTNVLTLQTALDYLYNIVKEREVEENARKAVC